MSYEGLANFVMIFHALLVLTVFVGILVSVRYKRFRPFESFILLSSIVIWSLYGGCPLTFLENFLRTQAGHPIPLTDMGFTSFYFSKWFGLSVTAYQFRLASLITALIFLLTSIEWLSPMVNPEIIKIRKTLGFNKFAKQRRNAH